MTQAEALYKFFSSFDIPAYPANSVPKDTKFPWLTYEAKTGFWGDSVSCAVNLYYHTDSEVAPNAKIKEIGDRIGLGGIQLLCDEGTIWVQRATPWNTPIAEADSATKHKQLMLTLDFN